MQRTGISPLLGPSASPSIHFNTTLPFDSTWVPVQPVIDADGQVFVTDYPGLVSLNGSTGAILFYNNGTAIGRPPTIAPRQGNCAIFTVLSNWVAPSTYTLGILDCTTGALLASWGGETDSKSSPAITASGIAIFTVTTTCTVYAIDVQNASLLWSVPTASWIYTTPALSADERTVYIHDARVRMLNAYDTATGTLLWRYGSGSVAVNPD